MSSKARAHPALTALRASEFAAAGHYPRADAGHQEEEEVAERCAEAAARGSQQAKKDLEADTVLHGARGRGRAGGHAVRRICGGTVIHNWHVFLDREIERLGPEAAEENEARGRAMVADMKALQARARDADDPAEEAELLRQAEKIDTAIREDDYALRRAQEEWMAQGRPPPHGEDKDGA